MKLLQNKKMPQDKKTKQTKASKPKEKPSLLYIGYLDLVFKLDLTDKDLEKKNASKEENKDNKDDKEAKSNKDNDDKYYKIEDFSDIKSLEQILKDNKSLWDRIVLKPGNDSVKQILIGNRASKKKCGVEYIGYGRPKFEGDDEYFDEIFNYVTEKNHLFVNKTPLDDGARSSLTIILTHKGKTQTIGNGTTPEEDAKEKEKKRRKKERREKKKAEEEKKKKEEEKRLAEEEKNKNQDKNQDERKDENQDERKDENQDERKDENQDEKKDEKKDKKDEKQNGKQNEKTDEKKDEKKEEEEEDKDLIFGDEDSDEGEEEDYEETEAMKAKKIPKFKRKNSVLTKLNPSQAKYDMFYISYYDLKDVPGDFKMQDLLELLNFFKKQGTNVFVNFYKPKPPEPPQVEDDEVDDDDHENDNEIQGEGATKEEPQEEEKEEKKEEKKDKDKENKGPPKKMIQFNQLIDFSQIFFFDTKQAPKLFNAHYEAFTEDNENNRKPIGKTKIFDYFITGIATATKEEVSGIKTGLFMDNFNKFNVIFTSKKAASKQELDAQPHPKRNHINQKLIDEYREIIDNNKNDYYSILLSLLVTTLAAAGPNCQSIETIYPAFVIALEIIKRKVECEKNKLQQDDSLYQVKVSDKALAQELQKFSAGDKESGFVLDCMNKDKSTMKDYVPLYDYHLKGYFSSDVIRKDLKNKGFINTKGFVMYDSVYRDVMNTKPKKKKKNADEEKEEKNTKIMSTIKGIDVPSRIQDKEINAEQAAKSQNSDTGRKLPFIKDNPVKKKKVKKHRGTGSKSGSGSGSSSGEESSSEEKSGEGSGSGSGSGNKEEESAAKE